MTTSGAKSGSALGRLFRRLLVEEAGQDIVEYGLLTLIVLAVGFLVFVSLRTKMGISYVSWGTAIMNYWEPSPPSTP